MNKKELIDEVADRTGIPKRDVGAVIDAFFAEVADVVSSEGGKVTVPGFISFEQVMRKGRMGFNPQTGEPMEIPSSRAVKVKVGSRLKAAGRGPGWTGPKKDS